MLLLEISLLIYITILIFSSEQNKHTTILSVYVVFYIIMLMARFIWRQICWCTNAPYSRPPHTVYLVFTVISSVWTFTFRLHTVDSHDVIITYLSSGDTIGKFWSGRFITSGRSCRNVSSELQGLFDEWIMKNLLTKKIDRYQNDTLSIYFTIRHTLWWRFNSVFI